MKTTSTLLIIIALAASLLAQSPTPNAASINPKQKETALMKVKDYDPRRAKQKMTELIAMGVPIKQSVQDAVNAAQPILPTPTPQPSPTPDGL